MNSRFFDVFLDASDHTGSFISKRIHVELSRLFEKLVDQNRPLVREVDRCAHVAIESFFVVDNRHRSPAKYIAWTHEHGITDALGDVARFFNRSRGTVFSLRNSELAQERDETLAIFSQVDRIRRRANDG